MQLVTRGLYEQSKLADAASTLSCGLAITWCSQADSQAAVTWHWAMILLI